jgi:hypothetical protein
VISCTKSVVVGHPLLRFPAQGVVVDDGDLDVGAQTSQGGHTLGIDQYHFIDPLSSKIVGANEGEFIPIEGEKIPQVPVQPARENRHSLSVEFRGPQHGSQGIEIGVLVGGDHFHSIFILSQSGFSSNV